MSYLLLPLTSHEACAVVAVRFESVVCRAPESNVLRRVGTTFGPGPGVSKLQTARRVAAVAVFSDKTATSAIAWPDFPTD